MKKKYFVNISYSLGCKIVAAIFLMFFDICIARWLTVDEYGEWAFFFSILSMMFCLGWLGINVSSRVHIARCESVQQQNNCIKASLIIRIIGSVTLALLIVLIMPRVSVYCGYPDKYPHLKTLMFYSAFLVILNGFSELLKEIYVGLQCYRNLLWLTAIEYGSYFTFTFIYIQLNGSIYTPVIAYILGGICVFFFGFIILHKKQNYSIHIPTNEYKRYIRPICTYAVPIALIGIGSMVLLEMDTFLLGIFCEKEQVAIYSIGKNLCSKMSHINYAIAIGTLPALALRIDNDNNAKHEYSRIVKMNMICTLVICLGLLVGAYIYIYCLYGLEYINAVKVIQALVPYYCMTGLSTVYSQFLDYRGKAKARSICYITVIVLNFVLDVLLIPRYGAVGAAIATNVALIPYLGLVYIYSKREIRNA